MQSGACCGPIVRIRVLKACVENGVGVHEIVEVKQDHVAMSGCCKISDREPEEQTQDHG